MKKIILFLLVFSSHSLFSQTWTQTLNGITIWSLAKDLNTNVYAGSTGASSRIFKSSNLGVSWDTLAGANGQTVFAIAFDSLGNMFAANFSAGLMKSTNGGLNFTTIPVSVFGNSNPQVVVCGKNGHVYVGTNGNGFYRSTDAGVTFTQTGLASLQVVSLLVDRFNSSIIYAGATVTNNGFYRSTDFGASFSSNLNLNKNIFGIMEVSPLNLFSVTTSASGNVDRSTDGGLTWNTMTTGYVSRGIALSSPITIYVAGNGGLFGSTNNGVTFTNAGITSSSTPVLTLGSVSLVGVSGTNGGVWYNIGTLGITGTNNNIPSKCKLFQNYPNPFNPSTIIKYQVTANGKSNRSDVKLIIYNTLGKEVETLVNERQSPGTYEVKWPASNYPSGIYYCKLQAGNYTASEKLVLIK